MPNPPGAWLSNLRRWRNRAERDLTIGAQVDALAQGARRASRALGGLTLDWGAIVPAPLAGSTRAASFSRGVLTIEADDAAALYAMDRWLRSGGERAIRAAAPTVRRVRLAQGGRAG
ncbi:MAG: DUF721 domain-containing protein [Phycisphaerae bacterium]|nr:DUF721 domain-containing protein [Phycisphaerae bacterium]